MKYDKKTYTEFFLQRSIPLNPDEDSIIKEFLNWQFNKNKLPENEDGEVKYLFGDTTYKTFPLFEGDIIKLY